MRRHLVRGIAAAALALGGIAAAASPAMAWWGDTKVDIIRGNTVLYNDISVTTAATKCGVSASALYADVSADSTAACPTLSATVVLGDS